MRLLKWILCALLVVILVYICINFKLVTYGFQQLSGQLNIIYNARPVHVVIGEKKIGEPYLTKLLLIQKIRKFAVDSLGLTDTKNFTTYYDQHEKPVLWVLTACAPFEMKAYEWSFPFLGNVSYKGFFKKEIGIDEEQLLKDHFFDTDLSPAGGWSTLGWFTDPILSNMLKRSKGQLAELIIHELTHATVYLPGSVEYNENLATFIGEEGAIRFIKATYGDTSEVMRSYAFYKEDEEVFGNYMLQSCRNLDSLYRTFDKESFRIKLQRKNQLIIDIILGIKLLSLHRPERYIFHYPIKQLPNNAWFLSFKRYRSRQLDLEQKLRIAFHDDLKAYVGDIKNQAR